MTPDQLLTLVVLGFAIWMFISEWVRVDVVEVIFCGIVHKNSGVL